MKLPDLETPGMMFGSLTKGSVCRRNMFIFYIATCTDDTVWWMLKHDTILTLTFAKDVQIVDACHSNAIWWFGTCFISPFSWE
jgi:hypothetical protein